MLYMDSSALVKLVVPEPGSRALEARIRGHDLVSSAVAAVEVPRAVARRSSPSSRTSGQVLSAVTLVALDDAVLRSAAAASPAELGTLDALHLSTAALVAGDLDAFITYDRQLAAAASAAGFQVEAPA